MTRALLEPVVEPTAPHLPVMVDRLAALLAVRDGTGVLVDATIGAGGHAAALLAASDERVHLVGFDRDPDALALAGRRLAAYGDRVTLVHAGYETMTEHVTPIRERFGGVVGVVYDLGVSSLQLDRPGRGFSFRADAPLDMRMDPSDTTTAADLVNGAAEADLVRWLREYGEERYARRVAAALIAARPLRTTSELTAAVVDAIPAGVRARTRIHPATRTFQALRIVVNAELERFGASLPQALELAATPARPPEGPFAAAAADSSGRGGRVAVLSYHSLEDRIAKRFFADAAAGCICPPDLPVCGCGRVPTVRLLTRGAERPDGAESDRNPRARSARLRVVEKI